MEKNEALKLLRTELDDIIEPFEYDDKYLETILNTAVLDYSRYRPVIKSGTISIKKGEKECFLPSDFMNQFKGFEKYPCLFFNNNKILINPVFKHDTKIDFLYYACNTLENISLTDMSLLMDFSIYKILTSNTNSISKIDTINVGRNLSLKTNNSISIQIANERLKHYITELTKNNIYGGWF